MSTAEEKMGRAVLIVMGSVVALVLFVGWGVLKLVGLL